MDQPTINLEQFIQGNFEDECIQNAEKIYLVRLQEGIIPFKGKFLVYNLFLWKPLIRRGMPISLVRHSFNDELLSNDIRIRVHTNIADDIVRLNDPIESARLRFEFTDFINDVYNFISVKNARHWHSVSIFQIGETMRIPELKKAATIDVSREMKHGIKAVEAKYAASFEELLKEFSDPKYKGNVFGPFLRNGAVSTAQFPQCIGAVGTRTDVRDRMVNYPITHSYLDGLQDIKEFIVDSFQAKKSKLYNKEEMPNTQYSNRKLQLLCSAIRYLYAGDCGTTVTFRFYIPGKFKKHVLGMNIVTDDGRLVELCPGNIDNYANKFVNLRSPATCRNTDGYCQTCGGRLTLNMTPDTVPGILAAIIVMSPIAQLVLSNKHFSKTLASLYALPDGLKDWFVSFQNEIHIANTTKTDRLCIGVPYSGVDRMTDLQYLKKGREINNAAYFSDVSSMAVGWLEDDGEISMLSAPINMMDRNTKSNPFFSTEFLKMVRKDPDCVHVKGNMVWFELKGFKQPAPLMQCVSVNASVRLLVRKIESFFMDKISEYHSIEDAVRVISNLIWENKTSPNLLHITTMIRAAMVTSGSNFAIPVVEDPHQVRFGKLRNIIPGRSIGAQLGFERNISYFSSPEAYIFPKIPGVFDVFFAFTNN